MKFSFFEEYWNSGKILKQAFSECKVCLDEVYSFSQKILQYPDYAPLEFKVSIEKIPKEYFSLKKNIFSTLFQTTYKLMDIPKDKRYLYGKLNYLFRVWVTAADNLLDNEDKRFFLLNIPGDSHVMRQLISTMTADRVLSHILNDAVESRVITLRQSEQIIDRSLQILLPSAAEESSECVGIINRPSTEYILNTIHKLKTAFLFHVPFLGPEIVGVDEEKLKICRSSMNSIGLGCQLLDDIRDMACDFLENRHNYVLSMIYNKGVQSDIDLLEKMRGNIDVSTKIMNEFSDFVSPTKKEAMALIREGFLLLNDLGLNLGEKTIDNLVRSNFILLDIGELL